MPVREICFVLTSLYRLVVQKGFICEMYPFDSTPLEHAIATGSHRPGLTTNSWVQPAQTTATQLVALLLPWLGLVLTANKTQGEGMIA